MAQQGEIVSLLPQALPTRALEDKGEIFNSDLTQAIELGSSRPPPVHGWSPGSSARRVGRPRNARTTIPCATTDVPEHTSSGWWTARRKLSWGAGADDQVGTTGA